MAEKESCHSRSLSWLVKPCIPSHPHRHFSTPSPLRFISILTPATAISSLPDDLLLECLSRLPASSLPSLPLVCRRFNRLLNSDSFPFLRRRLGLLNHSLIAVSVSSDLSILSFSTLRFHPSFSASNPGMFANFETSTFPLSVASRSFSHARAVSIGRFVYLIGRGVMIRYDVWTGSVTICGEPLFPRKKFAVAAVDGRIYVAGGSSRTSAVEEYDPESNSWRVIGEATCRRYGCVGATASGIFYIAGGLRLNSAQNTLDARTCAGSIDAYHISSGTWLRTHSGPIATVPAGGFILGACGIGDMLYIMASHALEISFWRWNGEVSTLYIRGGGNNGRWDRLKPPPVPGQVGTGLRFSCTAVGPNKVAALVHVSAVRGRVAADMVAAGVVDGALLVYDVLSGEWTRAPHVPSGSRRTSCVTVEC